MKALMITALFFAAAPSFAAPLTIRCEHEHSPRSYLEFVQSDEGSMIAKIVIEGRSTEPFRSYFKETRTGGNIGGSEEFLFQLMISGATLEASFERGQLEGKGLWKKGFGHSGVRLLCERNKVPNRLL